MPAPRPATPRTPKYRHYKPKDLAVVRLGGRDIYLGKYGSPESHEKYWRIVTEWNVSGTVPEPATVPVAATVDERLTIDELVYQFRKHGEIHYRHADGTPTGEMENFKYAVRPLRELFGGTPAEDFGPKRLKLVRQRMVDSGLSRGVVNARIKRIVMVFSFGVENELLGKDAANALREVKSIGKGRTAARETEPVKTVPDEHVDAIRCHVARQVWAMIELQRLTGMRPGEVVIMRTGDIDRSGKVWVYTPRQHKTEHHGRSRPIYVGPTGQAILGNWLKADPDAFLFSPSEARSERFTAMRAGRKSKVQPSQRDRKKKAPRRRPGVRYTVHTYYFAIRRGCARAFPHPVIPMVKRKDRTPEQLAELKEWDRGHAWHPNQLRHNTATHLRKEFGLDVARVILGHSNVNTTEIYAEADREKALRAMAEVG